MIISHKWVTSLMTLKNLIWWYWLLESETFSHSARYFRSLNWNQVQAETWELSPENKQTIPVSNTEEEYKWINTSEKFWRGRGFFSRSYWTSLMNLSNCTGNTHCWRTKRPKPSWWVFCLEMAWPNFRQAHQTCIIFQNPLPAPTLTFFSKRIFLLIFLSPLGFVFRLLFGGYSHRDLLSCSSSLFSNNGCWKLMVEEFLWIK